MDNLELPNEILLILLSQISAYSGTRETADDRDLSDVACINHQFYDALCELEKKNTCLLLNYLNLNDEDKVASLLQSSRVFTGLEVPFYGESLETKRAVIIDILSKFGCWITDVEIRFNFQTRTLLKVLELLPKTRHLSLSNITINGETYQDQLSAVKSLTNLKSIEFTDCSQVSELLEELPSRILETLSINSEDPQELIGLIEKQSTIENLSILSFNEDFDFPRDLFQNLQLKRLELKIIREDNQANYENIEHFLRHQQAINHLNLHKTRIGGGIFSQIIITMSHLQSLQLNIAFVPIQEFRRIGVILKELKSLSLYNEMEMAAMNIEFISALSTHSLPKLYKLDLRLGAFHYPITTLQHFRNIGTNSPNLKSFRLQARWSYELLHAVFTSFKQLRELKATNNGSSEESEDESEDEEDIDDENLLPGAMVGSVNCLYEDGLQNQHLESLHISHRMKSHIKIFRMLLCNFPKLKDIDVKIG